MTPQQMSIETMESLDDPYRMAAVHHLKKIKPPTKAIQAALDALAKELDVPLAAATFLDESQQHFIATNAGPTASGPRETSHCQYVVKKGLFLCIQDASTESPWSRLARNLVGGKPLTAYLGFPLRFDGEIVGAVCAVDTRERVWTVDEQFQVYRVSRVVADLLLEASRAD